MSEIWSLLIRVNNTAGNIRERDSFRDIHEQDRQREEGVGSLVRKSVHGRQRFPDCSTIVMAVEREVKFTLEQAMKALSRGKGTPYSFFNLDATCGRWFMATPQLLYPANDPVTIVQDVG